MANLKAVHAVPDVIDLSEFRAADVTLKRWREVLAELSSEDQAKLRAALVVDEITATSIMLWLDRRGITAHRTTIARWRKNNFATTA